MCKFVRKCKWLKLDSFRGEKRMLSLGLSHFRHGLSITPKYPCKRQYIFFIDWFYWRQYIFFIDNKQCQLPFAPVISYRILTWRVAESHYNILCKQHTISLVLNTKTLLIARTSISAPHWESRGIHYWNL